MKCSTTSTRAPGAASQTGADRPAALAEARVRRLRPSEPEQEPRRGSVSRDSRRGPARGGASRIAAGSCRSDGGGARKGRHRVAASIPPWLRRRAASTAARRAPRTLRVAGLVGFTVTLALVVQALVALHALLGVEARTLRQHARQLRLPLSDDRRRLLKLRHRIRGRLEIHDADTGLRSDPNARSADERRSVRQDGARNARPGPAPDPDRCRRERSASGYGPKRARAELRRLPSGARSRRSWGVAER